MGAAIPRLHQRSAEAPRTLALRVAPSVEVQVRRGHPWVFDRAIRKTRGDGRPGDLAAIYDARNKFVAVGLYDPTSPIRVRILHAGAPTAIDGAWFGARLHEAAGVRRVLAQQTGTTGYRLVHGENDGLPGLVIDRYDTTWVIKLYTAAWVPHLPAVVDALARDVAVSRIVLRLSRSVAMQREHLRGLTNGALLAGTPSTTPVLFTENGLHFEVDPVHGLKTGFFLDQRDNRARLGHLSRGASVLDVCAYTGGFSVYAARGGAREVVSIDVSRPALAAAQRNLARNRAADGCRHTVLAGDAFELLERLRRQGRSFGVVVLDPPSFASSAGEAREAQAAYLRLAHAGLRVLAPGGLFVAASCSAHVTAPHFFATLHRAAAGALRRLTELKRTAHPLDHPIRFPEGAYLKALFARA